MVQKPYFKEWETGKFRSKMELNQGFEGRIMIMKGKGRKLPLNPLN